MRVAVPVTSNMNLFHYNPCSAPMFALYTINAQDKRALTLKLETLLINPHQKKAQSFMCDCSIEMQSEVEHKIWHYTLIETLQGCDYILANQLCVNTEHALSVAGIKVHPTPIFIKRPEHALNHFILGEHYADRIQHIHYAS